MLKWDRAVSIALNCFGALFWLAIAARVGSQGPDDQAFHAVTVLFFAGLGCFAVASIIRCLIRIHEELFRQRFSNTAQTAVPSPAPPASPVAVPGAPGTPA